jgi:hypothetical protein
VIEIRRPRAPRSEWNASPERPPTTPTRLVSADASTPVNPSHPIAATIAAVMNGPMILTTMVSGDGSAIHSPKSTSAQPVAQLAARIVTPAGGEFNHGLYSLEPGIGPGHARSLRFCPAFDFYARVYAVKTVSEMGRTSN